MKEKLNNKMATLHITQHKRFVPYGTHPNPAFGGTSFMLETLATSLKKTSMKKTNIILIVIALIFAIIGFNSYDKFVNLLFYNETNIQLVSGNLSRQFFDSLFFSGLLLSIPISFLISWNFISIKDLKRRLVSISIIGIMLTLSLLLRMIILNKEISNNIPGYKTSLTFENLLINQYLFTGLIIGTIVNLIVLNRIKVK